MHMKKIYFLIVLLFAAYSSHASTSQTVTSFAQLLGKGGLIMLPLYSLSFIALCLIFFYLITLRIELIAPKNFLLELENPVEQKDYELSERYCKENLCVASKIIHAGLQIAKRTDKFIIIRNSIEDEGARQSSILWQKIQYLQDIAVIAPMLGLLGTVLGMIKSFVGLQFESVVPQQTQITSGISMALITTAAGLSVGIIAMLVHAYFRGRVTRIIAELEYRCNKILMLMADSDK